MDSSYVQGHLKEDINNDNESTICFLDDDEIQQVIQTKDSSLSELTESASASASASPAFFKKTTIKEKPKRKSLTTSNKPKPRRKPIRQQLSKDNRFVSFGYNKNDKSDNTNSNLNTSGEINQDGIIDLVDLTDETIVENNDIQSYRENNLQSGDSNTTTDIISDDFSNNQPPSAPPISFTQAALKDEKKENDIYLKLAGNGNRKKMGAYLNAKITSKNIQSRLSLSKLGLSLEDPTFELPKFPYLPKSEFNNAQQQQLVFSENRIFLKALAGGNDAENNLKKKRRSKRKSSEPATFDKILDPEEAAERIKNFKVSFFFIQESDEYYEKRMSVSISELYSTNKNIYSVFLNQERGVNGEKEIDVEDARNVIIIDPLSSSSKPIDRAQIKRHRACYFQQPKVSLWEYSHLPPPGFTQSDAEVLHKNDYEYYHDQYVNNRNNNQMLVDSESDNATDVEEFEGEIPSSIYEPEPLSYSKNRGKLLSGLSKVHEIPLLGNVNIVSISDSDSEADYSRNSLIDLVTPLRSRNSAQESMNLRSKSSNHISGLTNIPHDNISTRDIPENREDLNNDESLCEDSEVEIIMIPESPTAASPAPLASDKIWSNLLSTEFSSISEKGLYQKRKRDFTKFTTEELKVQVDKWGFKSPRSRTGMIDLLDSCVVLSPMQRDLKSSRKENSGNKYNGNTNGFDESPIKSTKSCLNKAIPPMDDGGIFWGLPKTKRDLDKMSTGDLKILLDKCNLKPVKSRLKAIEILKGCYNEISGALTTRNKKNGGNNMNNKDDSDEDIVEISDERTKLFGLASTTTTTSPSSLFPFPSELEGGETSKFTPLSTIISNEESKEQSKDVISEPSITMNDKDNMKKPTKKTVGNRRNRKPRPKENDNGAQSDTITNTNISLEESRREECSSTKKQGKSISKLDSETSLRISRILKADDYDSRRLWLKVLTYEPLNLDDFCNFLNNKLQMNLNTKCVREWCDQHGVTTTVAE